MDKSYNVGGGYIAVLCKIPSTLDSVERCSPVFWKTNKQKKP